MSEQQDHLTNLLKQRQDLIDEINGLQNQAASKRELLLRASGAIEYLQQIGVTLPEEEAAAEGEPEAPAPAIEGEVVNAEGDIPAPTPEG
tara:strand:- start:1852 stop:2121 length:270 start_codon:yes stop_codon:yes gene_type:complete